MGRVAALYGSYGTNLGFLRLKEVTEITINSNFE